MATKSNDEIISDYRERVIEILMPTLQAQLDGMPIAPDEQNLSNSDLLYLIQAHHMVGAYKADPDNPLIIAKQTFDIDDYKEAEAQPLLADLLKYLAAWTPRNAAA